MSKVISALEIQQLSAEFKLSTRHIKTVLAVESAGNGFDPTTGNIKIQFEPHEFFERTGKVIANGVSLQPEEWEAYEKAKAVNHEAALMSTSWGMAQIMGYNFKAAGYKTVFEMVNEFKISEYYQVRGMLNFISNQPKMFLALSTQDWPTFARLYNGTKYAKNAYDVKLKSAFNKILK